MTTHPLITMTDQYETQDGRPVRVLCVDRKSNTFPVIFLICEPHGDDDDILVSATAEGRDRPGRALPYIRKVRKKISVTGWVNLYPGDGVSGMYPEKTSADTYCGANRIACKQITIEFYEGEGLEK